MTLLPKHNTFILQSGEIWIPEHDILEFVKCVQHGIFTNDLNGLKLFVKTKHFKGLKLFIKTKAK